MKQDTVPTIREQHTVHFICHASITATNCPKATLHGLRCSTQCATSPGMTKTVTLREANQSFARCIREVEAGEEFLITRNGTPVARLVPSASGGFSHQNSRLRGSGQSSGWKTAGTLVPGRSIAMPCMSDRRFTLDTNILVYALDRQSGDRHTLSSRIIARALLADCWLTLQSISEFYAATTRNAWLPWVSPRSCRDWLDMFRTVPASASAVRTALAIAASGRVPYWDALLVVTAAEAGCSAILSEDLADGTTLAGIRVINPFAGAALSASAESLLSLDDVPLSGEDFLPAIRHL